VRRQDFAQRLRVVLALALLLPLPSFALAQMSGQDRSRARKMLETVREQLAEDYYDPSFGGLDLEAEYQAALQRIEEAYGINDAFGIIAQFVADLRDSHTYFVPPMRVQQVDYGFDMGFVGDTCFVTGVDEGSSAQSAGLQPGAAVLTIGPYKVERQTFSTLRYILYVLNPQREISLVARQPSGELYRFRFEPKITELPANIDPRDADIIRRLEEYERKVMEEEVHIYVETPDSVLLWKMPSFYVRRSLVDDMIERARKNRALILDLRDNPGGSVEMKLRLIGSLFDHEVLVGRVRTREGIEELVAEPPRGGSFLGQLVVLVNSGSASASEILARTMQLQGRGTVIGDQTAGAVMASRIKVHKVGFGRRWKYGTSVSVSDVIMPDGQRLENRGVMPDEVVLPSADDLRNGRDPAMARALQLVGISVDPATAAAMFERS
jgi:C-terminal processing protease CtpA/Prc